ncbi:zinc-finger of the FCS-type, C2-C2, variant 2 [Dionaea muscipula]
MLRKRSRPVGSKQSGSTVPDDNSTSPFHFPEKLTKPTSYFFNSPNIFKGLLTNYDIEAEPMIGSKSTTVMESKPLSSSSNPFSLDRQIPTPNPTAKYHLWDQKETRGIGLALIDSLMVEETVDSESPTGSKQEKKLVLFGSQLKIQVPSPPPMSNCTLLPSNSPKSPAEFGLKTPRSNLWPFCNSDCGIQLVGCSCGSIGEGLTIEEMELSEDYTCVISHGPNPKTTHIFGNCVVDSSSSEVSSPAAKRKKEVLSWSSSSSSSEGFLRFCHHCKVELGRGKDIYIYRGEKGFCSQECRCQEMLLDAVEN